MTRLKVQSTHFTVRRMVVQKRNYITFYHKFSSLYLSEICFPCSKEHIKIFCLRQFCLNVMFLYQFAVNNVYIEICLFPYLPSSLKMSNFKYLEQLYPVQTDTKQTHVQTLYGVLLPTSTNKARLLFLYLYDLVHLLQMSL